MTSAGHRIVEQLEREGVARAYVVPGESYLDVLDGLHGSSITTVVARHEGGAAFMALAEGRLTGRPGVAMVTRGPGAANAFIAIHTAYQDATPMVLLVGLIPVADRGREAFQEFDLTAWFGSTAKHVVTLDDPHAATRTIRDAMRIARTGRPGPVVIGLPEDVIRLASDAPALEPAVDPVAAVGHEGAARLADLLRASERPVVVVGGEGWDAETGRALMAWAERHGVPVASDFRAYDAVPHDSAAWVGSLGYGRSDALAALVGDADLHLHIGCARMDVLSDGYALGQDAPTVLAMTGDPLGHSGRLDLHLDVAPAALVAALPDVEPFDLERLRAAREAHERFSTPVPDAEAAGRGADVTEIMAVLREELDADAVVTYGAGNHAIWPARFLPHTSARSLAAPRNGAMGMGIPAAVAASLAFPGRQVVSVAGDGCFMMNGNELATAVGYGAPLVAIVVDNGIFATIREHQEAHYPGRPSGTHLTNPDFAALARSFGGHGETVSETAQFRDAFRRAVASGLPAVIHVHQDDTVRAPRSDA